MDCVVKIDIMKKGNELENRRGAAPLTYGSLNAYWGAFGEELKGRSAPMMIINGKIPDYDSSKPHGWSQIPQL